MVSRFRHTGIVRRRSTIYLVEENRNRPISTEITGYVASSLTHLHRITGGAAYLEAARKAARFLAFGAWNPLLRTVPFECSGNTEALAPAYFFDCGIIVRGLLAVWRVTQEPRLLEIAVECGKSMAEDFVSAGVIHPVLSLPQKQAMPPDEGWSRRPGCYQLKSALAWQELAAVTGCAQFARYYQSAAENAVAGHEAFLPGTDNHEKIVDRLHAYCYFLEGLFAWPNETERRSILRDGISRVEELVDQTANRFERSDVYAQLLRLRLVAAAIGILGLDRTRAEKECALIAEFQVSGSDLRISGGFHFGRRQGRLLPFVNPVSTAFAVQALEMWDRYQAGAFADSAGLI